jgi:signal transduction histidine kinase
MVTRPLGGLEHAVAQVKAGHWNVNLSNLKAKGEINRLTNHFQNMTEQLRDLYINLELKVEQRTNELDKANQVLKEHQQELEQVNLRLKETNIYKSEFLAVMSHELRTPLTSIIAFTEMMLEENSTADPEQKHCLTEVLLNSQILLRLINNILDLAKIEADKDQLTLDVVDLTDIVASVESVLAPLIKNKDLSFNVSVEPEVPLTKADPEKLRRIVENLAGNAVKFTNRGGKVEILVHFEAKTNEIIIKVKDNGIGIKEEDQKYIFEKFTQADSSSSRKYGGTGLGLSLAKELIELHQGWIKVDSQYGEGSTFIVGLPVQEIES